MLNKSLALILLVGLIQGNVMAGSLNEPGDFPVSERNSAQSKVSFGFNSHSEHYLITWSDATINSRTDVDIYGRILDGTGKAISKDIGISTGISGQAISAVAFDSTNKRYLVIWSDWRKAFAIDSDIYGQLINADGSLYGDNFVISEQRSVSQKDATVAYDPARQQFLVVWKDSRSKGLDKLYGRYIYSNGKPKDKEFAIAEGAGKQDRPSLYYDPKRKRFLAIWRDIVDDHLEKTTLLRGKGIFARFIDPAKPHQPTPGKLIDLEDDACLPTSLYAAAYSPDSDVFMVTWTTARDYQELGLDAFAAIIRADDAELVTKPFAIARTNDYQEFPSVTYDTHNKRFLAVWYDLRRDHSAKNADIYGRFVEPTGKMSNEFLISDLNMRGEKRYPVPTYSEKQDAFLIFWQDNRNAQKIYGKLKKNKNVAVK